MSEIKFEKVSEGQFTKDYLLLYPGTEIGEIKEVYNNIVLPVRGTSGAAGYDIRTPVDFLLNDETGPVTFPTGLRIKMNPDQFLMIVPRSGIGFKTGARLANTVGIIDSDYAFGSNEGHIMVKLTPGFKELSAKAGDRIVQGIIMSYCVTSDDSATETRVGGFGSTGVK